MLTNATLLQRLVNMRARNKESRDVALRAMTRAKDKLDSIDKGVKMATITRSRAIEFLRTELADLSIQSKNIATSPVTGLAELHDTAYNVSYFSGSDVVEFSKEMAGFVRDASATALMHATMMENIVEMYTNAIAEHVKQIQLGNLK